MRLMVLFYSPQRPVAPIYIEVCILIYKIAEVSNQMHAERWCMLEKHSLGIQFLIYIVYI